MKYIKKKIIFLLILCACLNGCGPIPYPSSTIESTSPSMNDDCYVNVIGEYDKKIDETFYYLLLEADIAQFNITNFFEYSHLLEFSIVNDITEEKQNSVWLNLSAGENFFSIVFSLKEDHTIYKEYTLKIFRQVEITYEADCSFEETYEINCRDYGSIKLEKSNVFTGEEFTLIYWYYDCELQFDNVLKVDWEFYLSINPFDIYVDNQAYPLKIKEVSLVLEANILLFDDLGIDHYDADDEVMKDWRVSRTFSYPTETEKKDTSYDIPNNKKYRRIYNKFAGKITGTVTYEIDIEKYKFEY